ncbi:transcription factor HES-1-B-like [Melanaphis sacchari]|uniref:Protein deadpan n=1 Tax=Melanaphis sacchari TaxID=742174 RepID=A0A2H8TIR9_9HEMI|nr:transcription factor HES-1-B-like [Melanaphis sacchari]
MSSTNNDSEDDDPRVHSSGMSSSGQPRRYELSKSELRKNNKPIMEKKRRARINQCLNELKTLILDALKKDPARHTKLEKADILEMTVRHLQSLHRSGSGSRPLAPAVCPTVESPLSPSSSTAALTAVVVQKFQTGYQECAGEVNRFVDRLDGVDEEIKKRLMSHLDSCVAKMRYVAAAAGTTPPPPPPRPLANNNNYSLHHRLDLQAAAAAATALAATASVPISSGRPVLQQQSLIGELTPPTVPPPIPPLPLPKVGRFRTSAFTAVHGQLPSPDVGSTPFVYCDEPDVSSTSSWAEDMAAASAVQHPPLDFSMKKTVAGCSNKRPLGDIPVNVPTANASSSHKQSAAAATAAASSNGDGPTAARVRRPEAVAAAVRPCDGPDSDPNMWRPW